MAPFQYTELSASQQTTAERVGWFDEANYWSLSRTFVDLEDNSIQHIGIVLSPDRTVVAGIAAHLYDDNGRVLYVDSLFTVPKYEGQGLGASLIGRLIDVTKVGNEDVIRLTPKAGSVDFYEHLGFMPVNPNNPLGPTQATVNSVRTRISQRHAVTEFVELTSA